LTELRRRTKEMGRRVSELRKSGEQVRIDSEIIAHMSEGVILIRASDDVMIYTNPKIEEMLGYGTGELTGRYSSVVSSPFQMRAKEGAYEMMDSLNRTGAWQGEMIHIRKDGTPFLCSARVSTFKHPFHGKVFLSVYTDITEHKKEQKKISEHIHFMEKLHDTIPNPVFFMDRGGRYTGCNRAFEEFTGMKKDEIQGKTVFDIAPRDIAEKDFEKDNELFDSPGTQTYEWKVRDRRGDVKEVIFNKATFHDDAGKIAGLIGVISDITALKEAERHFRLASTTDELTGLLNRRGFFALAQKQCHIASRNNLNLYFLFVDLDGLKGINDKFGHKAGDEALVDAANIMKDSFRLSDTVARIGGDEFVIIALETPETNREMLTRRLRENLDHYNAGSGKPFELSFSIGLTHYRSDKPCSVDELISTADMMMYEEKKKRKNH
jgi:diguanylate cyclase (GGDEF)-like protein/PAS domain S-box-containing protein